MPKYIVDKKLSKFTIQGLTSGQRYAFAVRVLEAHKNTFDFAGMEKTDEGVDVEGYYAYKVPNATTVSSTVLTTDEVIPVASTEGYPESGLLILANSEVVKYASINSSENKFLLSSGGRGLNDTTKGVYISGDPVKLFLKCQDSNANIGVATPTFIKDSELTRSINSIGFVVTDYTSEDKKFFQGFDYCGYHRPLPEDVLTGKDCGSYLGGEFYDQRGMNIFDRMVSREEVLLEQVGEKVILLKRVWDGTTCTCMNLRSIHPKVRSCGKCFGTGYKNGYAQYSNKRRSDKRVLVRFKETAEDLKFTASSHLEQVYEPQCWTLPMPTIRDRDMIVRYNFDGTIEYIYEVLDVNRERVIYNHYGRQNLRLKRMDKTDIIYNFTLE